LGKLGAVEIDLIEENYVQIAESRGIDAGHKVIQIFTDSSELKYVRVGRIERVGGG
jgi:hypothetical protein